jgi:hypothetical protein
MNATRRIIFGFLIGLLILILISCGSDQQPPIPTSVYLNPYQAGTVTPTSAFATETPFVVVVTPTPFTYTIAPNDTLIGIAFKFNIQLEDLLAANPGVSPQNLTVGATLRIPSGPEDLSSEPTPTPAVFDLEQVSCYATADGGLWCLALIHNPFADTLENITAQISLIDSSGQIVTSQLGVTPLNILPPGQSLPVAVFFPAPVDLALTPRAQVLTAIRLLPSDERYIPAQAQNVLVSVDWPARSAEVRGQVQLLKGIAARNVWVTAVAYDAQGQVIGFKKWESTTAFSSPETLPFSFSVFSLGPAIARVEVIIEARP